MSVYNLNGEQINKKDLSILFIGNSLTQDAIAYLPYLIANQYKDDIDFKIYMLYNSNLTLDEQYQKFINNETCNIFSVAENTTTWTNYTNTKTLKQILQEYKFDVVCLQDYFSKKSTYTDADIEVWNNCIKYVIDNYTGGNSLKFISLFHAPRRSTADATFAFEKEGMASVLHNTIIEDMIPAGISVYRALATELDDLGDQGHLSPDGTHTQEGLPCLIQTFATMCWLFDCFAIDKSVYGSSVRITTAIYNTIHVPGPNLGTGVITGTDAENLLAQEVAIKAYKEGKQFVIENLFSEN